MEKLNIPAGFIYKYQAEISLIDTVLELAKNEELTNNEKNKVSATDSFFYGPLFDWLESCIEQTARIGLRIHTNVQFPITSCWINKSTKLQAHHIHNHPNSFLSGILYLTDNTDSNTVFYSPNNWFDQFLWSSFVTSGAAYETLSFTPSKGTLLLFPSKLQHKVKVMKTNEIRYTLSFNTFINADLDTDGTNKSRLKLRSESLRQKLIK